MDDICSTINCLWDQTREDVATDHPPQEKPAGTLSIMCFILFTSDIRRNPRVLLIIYHPDTVSLQLCTALHWLKLSTIPEPRTLPWASLHADVSSTACCPWDLPHHLSNTTVQVPFLSPYPALYFSCTLLLSMYFSLSTMYFPHNNVNGCQTSRGKRLFTAESLMTSTRPSTC